MEILYSDDRVVVCVKPAGVLSTDEPGGMPELLRHALGEGAAVRSVHRLDRVVGGLMVYARTARAASDLSRQMAQGVFKKEYLAVVRGRPAEDTGVLEDLLYRDRQARRTLVVTEPGEDVRPARLTYRVLEQREGLTLLRIRLLTGRTHQIRCQFSHRGLPLLGDRKYGGAEESGDVALWSCGLEFLHPRTGEAMRFFREPPAGYPWDRFSRTGESAPGQS